MCSNSVPFAAACGSFRHDVLPGQPHLKLAEKDIRKTLRVQGSGKALFLDTEPAAKVSIFAESQSSFTQNIQVE